QIPLVAGQGIDYSHRTLAATDANLALTHETFKNDALIFAPLGKTTFNLLSDETKHGVSVTMEDAPYLGVWSPYPKTGDFVCIEPWWGIADTIGTTGDLTKKLGINRLEPGTAFEKGYTISIF
ncbi:aldose epimerase, partial [Lacticaseibacillus rhamnosus]